MRYHELTEARPWKQYEGQHRPCLIVSPELRHVAECIVTEAEGYCGTIRTGKTEVFFGYYVRIVSPTGVEWLGEDRSSMREALRRAAEATEQAGWSLLAIGLSSNWRETGLSANSGFGYDPAFPNRAVHMLEPPKRSHIE